jgi:hypothetical protein
MQSANGKYAGPRGESYTKYGEKTSEHGHWEVGDSYAGTNTDGERWRNQTMEWVEDNRKFEAPAAEPKPESKPEPKITTTPVVYSPEIQQAKERVAKFETDSLSGEMTKNIYPVKELAEQDQKYDFDSQQLIKNYLDKDQFQFRQARYNS